MSNLASIIMEGASVPSGEVGMGYDFSNSIVAESSFLTSACATLFSDIMEADMSYMVADVVGAAQVIHESRIGNTVDNAYITSIQEGVVKSGIEKIKNAFHKFIAKIREFYKRVIEWFKAMFSNSEDFVKRYGKMLQDKSKKVKDFHYTGFKYDYTAGDNKAKADKDKVDGVIKKLLADYDVGLEPMDTKEFHKKIDATLGAKFDESAETSVSDKVDQFLSTDFKANDTSEYQSDLEEVYQGGASSKSDIKDFEGIGIDKMINFLKNSSSQITTYQKDLTKYEENVKKVISKLDKYAAKDGEEGGENKVRNASYVSSLISAYLNLYKIPCNVQISMNKTIAKEWLGVLKKFYNFKGNKGAFESATDEDLVDPEALGTIESDTPDDILDDGKDTGDTGADDGGKGGSSKDDTAECATESAIASILEVANAYRL
jgi:hypothetical protein